MPLFPLLAVLIALPQAAPVFESGSDWLVPEIRIGEAFGPPEVAFGRITDIAVADDGTIFILDGQAKTVRSFSSTGEFLRSYGREGGGPGEFLMANTVQVDSVLVVSDAQAARQTAFSIDGKVLGTSPIPRPANLQPATLTPLRGDLLAVSTASQFGFVAGRLSHDPIVRVLVTDPARNRFDTLFEYRSGAAIWHPVGRDLPFGVVQTDFGYAGAWDSAGDSLIVTGDGYTGAINWYCFAPDGMSECGSANVGLAVRPVRERDRAALLETVAERYEGNGRLTVSEIPEYWSVVNRLVIADDGAAWVGHTSAESTTQRWTVIDREGGIVRRIELPAGGRIHVVKRNRIYIASKDEFDAPYLVVYRMR